MSRSMSRRSSFIGNRSLSDFSGLPRPVSGDNLGGSPHDNGGSPVAKKEDIKELSEEEDAAMAAYEAISAETGKDKKDIGMEELHEFLGRFGLMSREALKDDMKVSGSPNPMVAESPSASRRPPPSPAASGSNPAVCVAKGDFVDFICNHSQQQQQQQQQRGGGRARRVSQEPGSAGWIDRAVERQRTIMRGNSAGMGSPSTTNNNNNMMKNGDQQHSVSILDPQSVSQHDDNGGNVMMDGSDGSMMSGQGSGSTMYGQDMNESLSSIEMRLRQALEARASTPVPGALLLDHEKKNADGSPSPGRHGRRGSTPSGDRVGGVTNAMYSPSGSTFKTRGASRQGGVNTSMTSSAGGGDGPSSPSAVLRRHQQQQLEALLSIRRSGGNILQQRGSASSQRRTPSKVGGFSVVHKK